MRNTEKLIGAFILSLVLLYFPGNTFRHTLISNSTNHTFEDIYVDNYNARELAFFDNFKKEKK